MSMYLCVDIFKYWVLKNQPSFEISENCASRRSGFSLPRSPLSASHTTYPATFGTSFSLLGFSHLGHWHKINEDTKKTQGSELEGLVAEVWNCWGVKLPWQPCCCFSISWRAAQLAFLLACSVPSFLHLFFFFICLSVHTTPLLSVALALQKL